MKRISNIVLPILFTAIVTAATQTPPAPPATIEGMVVRAGTREPVANVRILLRPEVPAPVISGQSDAEGRYLIDGIPPGVYSLSASRTGFVPAGKHIEASRLVFQPGERRSGVEIEIQAAATLSGRVFDEERRARSAVTVQVLQQQYREGRRVLVALRHTATDDRGEYRIFDLEPGTYYVRALPEWQTSRSLRMAASTYYPGVTDPGYAVPIALTSGADVAAVDFVLQDEAAYSVQFQIVGGEPDRLVTIVEAVRRDNAIILDESVGPSGGLGSPEECRNLTSRYVCAGLTPGTYDIFARAIMRTVVQSPGQAVLRGRITVDVADRDVEDVIILALGSGITLQGRLASAGELPADIRPELLRIGLSPLSAAPADSVVVSPVTTDGAFTINGLEGRYRVTVTGLPPSVYLQSARYGGRDVIDAGLTLEPNPVGVLELVLGGPTGRVDGMVRTVQGDPAPASRVVLVPVPARRDNPAAYRSAVTDAYGVFSIPDAPPGEYRALAWQDIEPGAHLNREFVERFEQRGVVVTVDAGGIQSVALTAQ